MEKKIDQLTEAFDEAIYWADQLKCEMDIADDEAMGRNNPEVVGVVDMMQEAIQTLRQVANDAEKAASEF